MLSHVLTLLRKRESGSRCFQQNDGRDVVSGKGKGLFHPQTKQFCRERGFAPTDVALAWLLHNPVVPALISGPETLAQLTDSMRALSITLSAEDLARLDVIWPGPGGEAPEAYAW